jgi:hypothetical protein
MPCSLMYSIYITMQISNLGRPNGHARSLTAVSLMIVAQSVRLMDL